MPDILCPHCGMPNPDDQNICTFCRQPLRVAADDEAIRPGDMPTKKTTAELEPLLPQWLRDSRARARQNEEDDQAEQAAAEAAKPAADEPAPQDWLAGLEAAAHGEADEDIPEWMRSISPAQAAPSAPKREQPPKVEETFPRRQEISWEEEPAPAPRPVEPPPTGPLGATQSDDGIPYWLKNLEEEAPAEKKEVSDFLAKQNEPAQQGNVSPFESGSFRPNTGELINWLDKMSPQVGEPAPSMPSADQPASEPLPDWVAKLDGEPAEAAPASAEFNFDWLKDESSKPFTPFQPSQIAEERAPLEQEPPSAAQADLPDWMKPAGDKPQEILPLGELEISAEPQEEKDVPDWLSTMAAETPVASATPAGNDLPDWMQALAAEPAAPEAAPASVPAEDGLPDWMKPATEEPASRADEAGRFDWITPAAEEKSVQPLNVPAFLPGEESSVQADELFAVEMPDWLSSIAPTESKPAQALPQLNAPQDESIAPADLPSWVQAMRPVEAALPGTHATQEPGSQPVEGQGPLAGLRGVLPAVPGLSTSGKSKVYSIRLEPTADQQQHAALLEQMLEAETQAKPMRSDSLLLRSQRPLRWTVTAILFALIAFVLFTRLQVMPLPVDLTPESMHISTIMDALPNDAPVLLVFDYEPALAGELESASASFVDRLTVLRNPRYTVLSTSPTGAALAERFLSNSDLIQHERILNLGYLPGESTGILAFAMNPRAVKPFNTVGQSAWTSSVSQDVNAFSDYALVVLFTDRAESARAWVEQTSAHRNGRSLVVVSSAQAAPMIQPYLISGQVNALLSGLHGGAAFEGATGQAGSARRYWDAYNLSILVVVMMIFFGGMWNLVLGLRARRQEQADV